MPGEKLDETLMEEIKAHTYKWYEFGCKDASYLKTKEEFHKLSFSEKALLIFHLSICKYCRRFVKQVNTIEALLRLRAGQSDLKISPQKKQSINQLITENLQKN
jgi:thioredoxin-related protein